MAKSQFEYVKDFETDDALLPNCFSVVRIDGRSFTKFTSEHGFEKPNDARGLSLMVAASRAVISEVPDIVCAYTQSDEASFVFSRHSTLYRRRSWKISSAVVSVFTAAYVRFWPREMGAGRAGQQAPELRSTPSFDARCVCYPTLRNVLDYLSWRQADCHINNLYNTCFWALIQKDGQTAEAAHKLLMGTLSEARADGSDKKSKHELLFERGINYNDEPAAFRRGSLLVRAKSYVEHCCIIRGRRVVSSVGFKTPCSAEQVNHTNPSPNPQHAPAGTTGETRGFVVLHEGFAGRNEFWKRSGAFAKEAD